MRYLFLATLAWACAHRSPQSWEPQKNAATQRVHQQVLAELSEEGRRPASPLVDLSARVSDLNRVRPGKFEVYVFPKVTSQTSKSLDGDEGYLAKPRVFEVSLVAENPCRQFIQRGLFANLRPQEVFPAELAERVERRCAILEVTDKRLRTIGRGELKLNDELKRRVFIDDSYRVHAVDHTIYETPAKNREVRVLNTEGLAMLSGLSLFPVDFPSARAKARATQLQGEFAALLDGIALYQLGRLNKSFRAVDCEGSVLQDRDDLGSAVRIGWCKGMPWPAYVENERFFAVTQNVSLGGAQ